MGLRNECVKGEVVRKYFFRFIDDFGVIENGKGGGKLCIYLVIKVFLNDFYFYS